MTASFLIACPNCGKQLKAKPEWHGRHANCPQCATPITIVLPGTAACEVPPVAPKTTEVATPASSAPPQAKERSTRWPKVTIGLGLFGWLVFANWGDNTMPLLTYPCIIAACVGAYKLIALRRPQSWLRIVTIVATCGLLYIWAGYDTIIQQRDIQATRYRDTYTRWSHRHIRRKLQSYKSANSIGAFESLEYTEEGPIAGTGKPHGEWETVVWNPSFDVQHTFYWYGESVSEGEWHLRNSNHKAH